MAHRAGLGVSAPSHRTRIRSAIRRAAEDEGEGIAVRMAIEEAVNILGRHLVVWTASGGLLGAREVAEMVGIKTPNLKHEKGLPEPQQRISGGTIPVYLKIPVVEYAEKKAAARSWD